MPFGDFVPVRTYGTDIEAEVARSALEAAGLHAVVQRDDCGGMRPSLWLLTGIALLVHEEDMEIADEILGTLAHPRPEAVR